MRSIRWFLLGLITLGVVACGKRAEIEPAHAIDVSWQRKHPDFHLQDAAGKPRQLSDFADKVSIVFFGYTHCPEVCPTTLADLAQAMRELGPDAEKVQVIFVTLDPERDTPQVLGSFVPAFDSRFLGLTGDAAATDAAAKSFGVVYAKQPAVNGRYQVDHSDGTFLVGRGGGMLWMSPYGQRTDWLVEDIRLLLGADKR